MNAWKNQPPTLRLIVGGSRQYGDAVCLVYEDKRITCAVFNRAVAALVANFVKLGVRKTDRVAIVMRNLPEWAVAF